MMTRKTWNLLAEAFKDFDHFSSVAKFTSISQLMHHFNFIKCNRMPDLLLFDYSMSPGNDTSLVPQIRKNKQLERMAITIYSTAIQPSKVQTLFDVGADYVIEKANSLDEINRHIKVFYDVVAQKQLGNNCVDYTF